jgi:hypothetical protein
MTDSGTAAVLSPLAAEWNKLKAKAEALWTKIKTDVEADAAAFETKFIPIVEADFAAFVNQFGGAALASVAKLTGEEFNALAGTEKQSQVAADVMTAVQEAGHELTPALQNNARTLATQAYTTLATVVTESPVAKP